MNIKKITSANREAWEQVAPIHASHNQENLIDCFQNPDFTVLNNVELNVLNALNIKGKDVAQICCNNGRELISIKRMGAGRCVGFDGAQGFVGQGRELAEAAGVECEFVCTDIYDIEPAYHGCFDVVTITIGVIGWMPDLQGFFDGITALLRPGGALFIYEQHPFLYMMYVGNEDDPVGFELSYFTKEPYEYSDGLDYYGDVNYDAKPVTSFSYTMSDTIMAGVNAGMAVEHFKERPEHISNTWWNIEKQVDGFPMSYTLVFRKNS